MKRVLIVQQPQIPFAKKEETVCVDGFNFSRDLLSITDLIKNTFSSLEQKINSLDSKINSVSSVCSSILYHTENIIKGNKSSFPASSMKCCQELSTKIENVNKILTSIADVVQLLTVESVSQKQNLNQEIFSAPVVLVPNKVPPLVEAQVSLDSSFQVISLNSEQDYPDGSWLGDDTQMESKVRVPITPGELLHINTHCLTPEKMALTLLDHLFPREVLAISNLTGKGKHGKKQLDPLFIYGIRCHLLHRFGISEKDWFRIKQNMDSKCRTVWRRKLKGLPIGTNRADQNCKRKTEENQCNESELNRNNFACDPFIFANGLISENEIMEDIEEEDEELEEETEIIQIAEGSLQTNFETSDKFDDCDDDSEFLNDNFSSDQLSKMDDSDDFCSVGGETLTILTSDGPVDVLNHHSPVNENEFIIGLNEGMTTKGRNL
ncbi:protein BANP-like [Planococcus citri]|uniref:protein BANP-like n=1 Tax=Planococcus citri TaxID=170843 RepID=UPI0031F8B8D4